MVVLAIHGIVDGFNLLSNEHGVEIVLCLKDEFGHVPGLYPDTYSF